MKKTVLLIGLVCMLAASFAYAQTQRADVIWARAVIDEAITLDGVLNESAWAKAESIVVVYPTSTVDLPPGSGFFNEGGAIASDPTHAIVKFLVQSNRLYLAVVAKDSSVGGGLFNQFDGFLMNMRSHATRDAVSQIAPVFEYFYGWVTEPWADPNTGAVGASPGFFGWAGGRRDSLYAEGFPRSEIWNAVTTVQGTSNDDTTPDVGWTTEIEFNLDAKTFLNPDNANERRYSGGYDVTDQDGDIIEFNMSIYDADWQWPQQDTRYSRNRTWLQGPWGNASVFNVLRIHARPDVTVNSGPAPEIDPEVVIPNGVFHDAPTIDGSLNEGVWDGAANLDIRYGDDALRESYPSIGPYRSGQFQPELNSARAAVLDPADATLKLFFKDNWLYLGVDVRDQSVFGNANFDQWDGVRIFITEREELNGDNSHLTRTLTARVGDNGALVTEGYLSTLLADTVNGAHASLILKPGTTANDFNDVDTGYEIELAVDLTYFGYPAGRGDGALWIGACLHDGDEFPNVADNYGNRVWWMKEHDNNAGPAWAYMDPTNAIPAEPPVFSSGRSDAVWARTTTEVITLDGQLDETSWANAEAFVLRYPTSSIELPPGSGFFNEGGSIASDPTNATIKFLVRGNKLYLGVVAKDKSVGGGLFNQFDGFLMNMRSHATRDAASQIAPVFEYFYGWVTEPWADPNTGAVGASPGFFGWAGGRRDSLYAEGFPRSEIWNAVTSVQGTSNDDATPDVSWTTEIEFNLDAKTFLNPDNANERRYSGGYDVTRQEGDIIEFNMSIYDADWQWPLQNDLYSRNRTWLQGPWGNASVFNVVRIHARPDVTVNSGPVPEVGAELVIPNGVNFDAPAVDGKLDEAVWSEAAGFDIRYGDDDLRASYPAIGPYRSGQFQPELNGARAAVLDPADATLKWFFKEDMLYIGVDVRDGAVWGNANFDQWDGIRIFINDREILNGDNSHLARTLTARVGPDEVLVTEGFLSTLLADTVNGAQAGLSLKTGSTVNNFNDVDDGYQIELALDLSFFGYPSGRGDGVLYVGACLHDGDEFANVADNYGNRVWWMKEHDNNAGPAYAYMDPSVTVGIEERDGGNAIPKVFALLGNYPNPFNPSTTIRFAMPEAGIVTLKVYDILGRTVANLPMGMKTPGEQKVVFNADRLSSGVYFYRLHMLGLSSHKESATRYRKMMYVK